MSLWLALTLAALDARYPGWRLAPVAPQIESWFQQYRRRERPNLVQGDFDSDGRLDVAVQILHKGRQHAVALLDRRGGYEVHPLANDAPDPFTFLILYRKGEKDFDFEALKPFRYSADALGVLYFRKTALTFQWKAGGFTSRAAPGDEEVEAAR